MTIFIIFDIKDMNKKILENTPNKKKNNKNIFNIEIRLIKIIL